MTLLLKMISRSVYITRISSFLWILLLGISPIVSSSLLSSSPLSPQTNNNNNNNCCTNSHADVGVDVVSAKQGSIFRKGHMISNRRITRRNRRLFFRRPMTSLNSSNEISSETETEDIIGDIDAYEIEYDEEQIGDDDDDDDSNSNTSKKKNKRLIEISSQIELPFSAEIAYDAYTNLPRQSSWSSWLESVEVLDNTDNKIQSCWTSKMMGIKYSWVAIAIKNDRPHTIQWSSVTGLQNEGIVRFHKMKGSKSSYKHGPTLMTIKMSFVTPRAVSLIIRRSKTLTNYVEKNMIEQSLNDFRDIVLENDVKKKK